MSDVVKFKKSKKYLEFHVTTKKQLNCEVPSDWSMCDGVYMMVKHEDNYMNESSTIEVNYCI